MQDVWNVCMCDVQKSNGSYNMPDSSIILQGATAQLTGRNENTFDILLVIISTVHVVIQTDT